MKKRIVKQPQPHLIPLLAISALALSLPVCKGTTVFSETFSQAPGTLIVGKSADVGGTWTGSGTDNTTWGISSGNTADTSGAARLVFNGFTSALGAGEVITLSFDTYLQSNGAGLNGGWAGVSLFDNYVSASNPGNEDMFLGEPSATAWGKDGGAIGGQQYGTDGAINNHLTLTYYYDTGKWTFASDTSSLNGTGTAGLALNGLRIGNGNNGDINLDSINVDISPVPEPTSVALVGAGMGMLLALRRRRS